ncbi:hypothetical protein GGG16DRAFT_66046, partial [Schizophyllum commune]
ERAEGQLWTAEQRAEAALEMARQADERASYAEKRAATVVSIAREASGRVTTASTQVKDAEARARSADARIRQAKSRAEDAEKDAASARSRLREVKEHLRAAEIRAQAAEERTLQVEALAAELEDRAANRSDEHNTLLGSAFSRSATLPRVADGHAGGDSAHRSGEDTALPAAEARATYVESQAKSYAAAIRALEDRLVVAEIRLPKTEERALAAERRDADSHEQLQGAKRCAELAEEGLQDALKRDLIAEVRARAATSRDLRIKIDECLANMQKRAGDLAQVAEGAEPQGQTLEATTGRARIPLRPAITGGRITLSTVITVQ